MSDQPPASPPKPTDPTPPAPPPEKTFTQAELNALLAAEKRDGKKSGLTEAMASLGVTTLEEAQQIISATRTAEDKLKTETERAAEAARKGKEEAEGLRREAAKDRLAARIERALTSAGVPEDQVSYVARMVEAEDDADAEAVSKAVTELKEKLPQLFGTDTRKPPPNGDPGKPPRAPTPRDSSEQAKDLLKSRHPQKLKSTS